MNYWVGWILTTLATLLVMGGVSLFLYVPLYSAVAIIVGIGTLAYVWFESAPAPKAESGMEQ